MGGHLLMRRMGRQIASADDVLRNVLGDGGHTWPISCLCNMQSPCIKCMLQLNGMVRVVSAFFPLLHDSHHNHTNMNVFIALQERFADFAPTLTRWSSTIVPLTLILIGLTGIYESHFSKEEHDNEEEAALEAMQSTAGDLAIAGEQGTTKIASREGGDGMIWQHWS